MATESFFSNASLAYLASAGAGKDGKTYSIKPTDGSGDFTFSRGSNLSATRVGPTGLIEKGRENLLTYSNDFSNADWVKSSTSVTSGQTGYDGSSDAWLLERTGASAYLQQTNSDSGVLCYSVYLKKGTYNWAYVRVQDSAGYRGVYFDLENATTGLVDSGIIDYNIEAIGTNGWYRCSIVLNSTLVRAFVYPSASNNGVFLAGTGDIYIQDAQLEIGLAATDYIESGATTGKAGLLEDEPRFDYSGGATCPSLLLEPSRTNLVSYSEYIEEADQLADAQILTTTDATPEGTNNARVLAYDGGTNQHYSAFTPSVTNGETYTFSVFLKKKELSYAALVFLNDYAGRFFDLETGTILGTIGGTLIDSKIEDYGNGWYRCSITDVATSTSKFSGIFLSGNGTSIGPFVPTGTDGLYIYGAQLEAGSYPTSYIPNHSGGSVTRGLDAMNNSSLGLTDCTFFVDFVPLSSVMGLLDFYDNSNAMIFYIAINSVKYLQFNGVQGGTIGSVLGPLTIGDRYKLAFTLNASTGDVTIFVNGTKYGTYSTTISSLNKIFQVSSFGYYNNTEFNQILTFGEILSDADCITLTT